VLPLHPYFKLASLTLNTQEETPKAEPLIKAKVF
jgi:hypothetical protein